MQWSAKLLQEFPDRERRQARITEVQRFIAQAEQEFGIAPGAVLEHDVNYRTRLGPLREMLALLAEYADVPNEEISLRQMQLAAGIGGFTEVIAKDRQWLTWKCLPSEALPPGMLPLK